MTTFDRITSDPAVLNGQPCIRGQRLTVRRVLEALATHPNRAVSCGWSIPSLRMKTSGNRSSMPRRISTIA